MISEKLMIKIEQKWTLYTRYAFYTILFNYFISLFLYLSPIILYH
jgi:hypothetical protein